MQEMVSGGVEMIVGVLNDPRFGPATMVGLGGIFTEILKDVVFRFGNLSEADAHDMIEELKGAGILKGARGKPPADVTALAAAISRVSILAVDLKDELAELDINPLFVLPGAGGVKAGDVLIKVRGPSQSL